MQLIRKNASLFPMRLAVVIFGFAQAAVLILPIAALANYVTKGGMSPIFDYIGFSYPESPTFEFFIKWMNVIVGVFGVEIFVIILRKCDEGVLSRENGGAQMLMAFHISNAGISALYGSLWCICAFLVAKTDQNHFLKLILAGYGVCIIMFFWHLTLDSKRDIFSRKLSDGTILDGKTLYEKYISGEYEESCYSWIKPPMIANWLSLHRVLLSIFGLIVAFTDVSAGG